jgi:hypothetical protein
MTGYDWSEYDDCCANPIKQPGSHVVSFYECPEICSGECPLNCDEFYYSRMPRIYEYVDKSLCLIYLVNYVLKIFISQNRCQYFIEGESVKDLMVIVPVVMFDYECG